jgi:hypothetical protein
MNKMLLTCLMVGSLTTAAHAQYTFVSVEAPFPGASNPVVLGFTTNGTILGAYTDVNGNDAGFLLTKQGTVQPLLLVSPQAVTPDGSWIVGTYLPNARLRGFLYHAGSLWTLGGPPVNPYASVSSPAYVEAIGISPTGIVVGDYRDGDPPYAIHGFTYNRVTQAYTTLDVPFPNQGTTLIDRNSAGAMVGLYVTAPGQTSGFLLEGGVYTHLAVPGAPGDAEPMGINDTGLVVGVYGLWPSTNGFTYSHHGGYTVFGVPGALLTEPFGVTATGILYGRYVDSALVGHGFLATPTPGHHTPAVVLNGHDQARVAAVQCQGPSKRWACRH